MCAEGGFYMKVFTQNPNNVARYLLSKKRMSQKKLHKLLYFSFVLFLTENNNDENSIENVMFENTFQAWVHGPVLREIYPIYANYGYRELFVSENDTYLDDAVISSCDDILTMFGDLSANQLENMSHQDLAWRSKRLDLSPFEPSQEILILEEMFASGIERFYD